MRTLTLTTAALLLALAGCDRLGLGGGAGAGAGEEPVSGAIANGAAPPAAAPGAEAAAPADAGVTSSRSFAGLTGGGAGGGGGKDPAAAAAPAGAAADARRALVVGRWTDDGDCKNGVDFLADGSFRTAGGHGSWSVDGDMLTISGTSDFRLRLQSLTAEEMVTVNEAGSVGRSTRC